MCDKSDKCIQFYKSDHANKNIKINKSYVCIQIIPIEKCIPIAHSNTHSDSEIKYMYDKSDKFIQIDKLDID